MKEIIIDNQKYFAYSEEEMNRLNKHTNDFYESQGKIKDDYPKILSFRETGSNNLFVFDNNMYADYITPSTYYSLDEMLHGGSSVDDDYVEIYQVAKSENETFTLGDNAKYVGGNHSFIIDDFFLRNDDVLLARSKDSLMVENVMTIEKVTVSLFITEDKIEISNKDQYVYGVCTKANWQTGEYLVSKLSRARNNQYPSFNESSWKFFSTKELRDEYRNYNMPKFSSKQINEILDNSFKLFSNEPLHIAMNQLKLRFEI